jgi:hypothetical protein
VGIEDVLLGLADRVLDFDEASLGQLQEKYLKKVSEFSPTRDWERSIVVYFLINSVRVKRFRSARSAEILKKHAENS